MAASGTSSPRESSAGFFIFLWTPAGTPRGPPFFVLASPPPSPGSCFAPLAVAPPAIDGVEGVVRIRDRLALGRLAHQPLVVLGEGDDRGRGAITLAVLDHARLPAFHHGNAGIRGAEVDADYLAHSCTPTGLKLVVLAGVALFIFKYRRGPQLWVASGARATMTRAGRSNRPLSR